MSLNALKETLRPCTNPSFSTLVSYTNTSISREIDSVNPRKPPKSSLSKQLQRLEDPFSLPQTKPPNQEKHVRDHEEEDEGVEAQERFEKPQSGFLQFDPTGPFEPLVLSSDGEFPVIQVNLCTSFSVLHCGPAFFHSKLKIV